MQHSADRRGNIDDVGGFRGGTVIDVPTKENQRTMGVVGVPFAVGRADVVVFELEREHLGAWQGVNIARAQAVVTVYDALADELRNGC